MTDLEQPIPERPLLADGRVWLRPLEERDLAGLMAIVNDREVGWLAGFRAPWSPDGARGLAGRAHREGLVTTKAPSSRSASSDPAVMIGTVWLNHLSLGEQSAELAIAMDAAHVGNGWGTEAQRALLAFAFGASASVASS